MMEVTVPEYVLAEVSFDFKDKLQLSRAWLWFIPSPYCREPKTGLGLNLRTLVLRTRVCCLPALASKRALLPGGATIVRALRETGDYEQIDDQITVVSMFRDLREDVGNTGAVTDLTRNGSLDDRKISRQEAHGMPSQSLNLAAYTAACKITSKAIFPSPVNGGGEAKKLWITFESLVLHPCHPVVPDSCCPAKLDTHFPAPDRV